MRGPITELGDITRDSSCGGAFNHNWLLRPVHRYKITPKTLNPKPQENNNWPDLGRGRGGAAIGAASACGK